MQYIPKPYDVAELDRLAVNDTETTFENVRRGQSFRCRGTAFVKTGQTMAASFEGGRVMFHPCQPVTAISNK